MAAMFDDPARLPWRVSTVVFVMILFGIASAVAEAKMPPFEIDVAIDGTTATITVVIDSQYGFDAADLDGLLGVYPASRLDDRLRPQSQSDAVAVDLDRVETGIFCGTVDLERAGRWAVVPFPATPEYEPLMFYPDTMLFETTSTSGRIWIDGEEPVAGALVISHRGQKIRWLSRPAIAGASGEIVASRPLVAMSTTRPTGEAFACPITIPTEPRFVPP